MTYGTFGPLRAPEGFWLRNDVHQALRNRDIGGLFRVLSRHGISQTKISAAVGIEQSAVSKILNRKRRIVDIEVFRRIADGLGMPDDCRALLGLGRYGQQPWSPDIARQATGYDTGSDSTPSESEEMRRRSFLAVGTASVISSSAVGIGGVSEGLRASLLFALGKDDWREIVSEHGMRFMTDPPERFQARLAGDLLALQWSMADSKSVSARIAAPRLIMLQGMIIANGGDAVSAARWYRAARIAADETGDDRLRQWARGRGSFRRGYEGASPTEVLEIAAAVEDVEAKLASAQAYARLGLRASAREEIEHARRIHESADQNELTIYSMPPWRMALSSAYVYALLGEVDRCERELNAVVPPSVVQRWEAQRDMELAVAYAKSGDMKAGADSAREIMRVVPEGERSIVLVEMYREATHTKSQS